MEVGEVEGGRGGAGRSWATNKGPRKAGCRRREAGSEGRGVAEEEGGGRQGEEGERRGVEGVCSS